MIDIRKLAAEAHAGQLYGDRPYTVHLDDVSAVLREFGYTDSVHQDGAYIHDVAEDTETTGKDLMDAGVSDDAVAVMFFCTDESGHNRKTRKARTYTRMHALLSLYLKDKEAYIYVPAGVRVKLADRIANIRTCIRQGHEGRGMLKMYRRETVAFRDALYHPGMADAMWEEYDKLMGG